MTAVATWVGFAVLALLVLVVLFAVWAPLTMLALMAVSRNARTGAVERKPFRAPLGIWQVRWAHFLRYLTRSHDKVSGEREEIQRIGVGAFLWADNYRRDPIPFERDEPWLNGLGE